MGITNVPNEFIEDGDIADDANTFSRMALRRDNSEGEIRDITILLVRGSKWANL